MLGLPIGWFEVFVIGCAALMVLGPEKFPHVAKLSMKTFRDIRKYMTEAQRDITNELNPLKKDLEKFSKVDIEKYLEDLVDDDKGEDENSINDEQSDSFEDDVMLTPDEYDNPDDWFQEDALEDDMPDDDLEVTGSEAVEESVAYDPSATEEQEIDDSREEIVDEDNPERKG